MSDNNTTNSITSGVATGRTVFDFANDVIGKLWEGPGKSGISFYKNGSRVRELKKKLGEWAHEAQDDKGRWLQPVLTKAAFESHLITAKLDNGHLQPSGESTASFNWAKLLYTLNIRPKQGKEVGIISWRLAPEGELSPAQTGIISLAIHGAVLCHIINLYQTNTNTYCSSTGTFQLPFGEIKLQDDEKRSYTFRSLGSNGLTSPRDFFPYSMRDKTRIREGYLISGTGIAITSYLRALENGISKTELSLTETEKPLPKRVKFLLDGMDAVNERDWNKPYLIAPSWIELATRIKRRATTNGGKSDLLMQHIVAFISKDSDVVKRLKMPLQEEDTWQSLLASTIKALFMFDNDQYEFIWNLSMELSSRENPQFLAIVKDQLLRALQQLSETSEGQLWLRTISEPVPAEDLLKVLNTPHRILNRPVIVLQHMPDEWNFLGDILD